MAAWAGIVFPWRAMLLPKTGMCIIQDIRVSSVQHCMWTVYLVVLLSNYVTFDKSLYILYFDMLSVSRYEKGRMDGPLKSLIHPGYKILFSIGVAKKSHRGNDLQDLCWLTRTLFIQLSHTPLMLLVSWHVNATLISKSSPSLEMCNKLSE